MTTTVRCATCANPVDQPYRRHDADGNVIEGCISAAHNAHADLWHLRPEAERMRNRLLLGISSTILVPS